ncbi:MAG: N-acetylneuraminate synthase, partial [FCB group bacterium]|nr:N-acetylneuraminate synthase [FCB group bacterium]
MIDSKHVFIIAEAGINHNGDLQRAKDMISAAKECGVDCVKFQTFQADQFVSDPNQTYTYRSQGREVTESMLEMFRRYQFERDDWLEIIDHCRRTGIVFSSTAQNPSDLDFLFSIVDLPFVKVGSDDLTNLALMRHYALKQKPMIISAGMAFAYEIEDAVSTIREAGNEDITVLHCVS